MLDPALREGLIEPPRLLLHLGVKVYFLDNGFERGEKRLGFCAIFLESQRQTSGVDNSVTCAEVAAHRNRVDGLDLGTSSFSVRLKRVRCTPKLG